MGGRQKTTLFMGTEETKSKGAGREEEERKGRRKR